ncbi:cysteine--tRNA ligase [Chloroflexota bacterium]
MKVYNTLSGQKEEFLTQGDEVKMYVCGVTPYSDCHLGHAMSYIIFDVIRRYLQFRGYKVKYVQNITDIDDKIIDRANQRGISTDELAGKYIESIHKDMDALNINRADVYPRVTEEIPKIIEVIQGLLARGYAYSAGGSVYFRVKSVPDYGKLSRHSSDSIMSVGGVLGSADKESPMDFVLWKAAKPGEPSWKSPWGAGRPGWHIECSAMSLKYLGGTIDIHGGGQDLVFPHHENEIAQSESFSGVKPFVRYWLHNGLVWMGEEKMSKSLGNLITIKEALEKYSPDAIRIYILSSHYRSPLTYSEVTLQATEVALRAFNDAKWKLTEDYSEMNRSVLEAQGIKTDDITSAKVYRDRFTSAMDDDFNTAQALATLFDLAQEINRAVNLGHEDKVIEHREIFKELVDVLGLTLEPCEELPVDAEYITRIYTSVYQELGYVLAYNDKSNAERMIHDLVEVRQELREGKQWQQADMVRNKLDEAGIALEDTPKGTVWRRKR